MSQDNKEDILLKYFNIALISTKVRILVIGGGKAAYIKCKTLTSRGCNVTAVALEFCEEFKSLENIEQIIDNYKVQYLENKHIIIIAISFDIQFEQIIKDCEEKCKIYLNCADFTTGQFVLPSQGSTKNVNFSINVKDGNPKTSLFLKGIVKEKLQEYDELVSFNNELRRKIKNSPYKKEIMAFTATEDFNFFTMNGVQEFILKMFYGGNNFEYKNSYEKK